LIEASCKTDVVLDWHRPTRNLHDNVNCRSKVKFNYNTCSSCRDEKFGQLGRWPGQLCTHVIYALKGLLICSVKVYCTFSVQVTQCILPSKQNTVILISSQWEMLVFASLQLSWLSYFKISCKGIFCTRYRNLHILVTLFLTKGHLQVVFLYKISVWNYYGFSNPSVKCLGIKIGAGCAHFQYVIASWRLCLFCSITKRGKRQFLSLLLRTHEFFQEVCVTVLRKIHSKLLFFVSVPQTSTKLYPKVHKQWVTPANNTVCVLGKQERAFMCYQIDVSVLVVRLVGFVGCM